jgi:DNA (cytosine-5)-methyltransferase 1
VVRLALNHWKLAVETHNTNFPLTDHDCADISAVDPRKYPSTDILITSPECTNHTIAKGKPRRYYTHDLFGTQLVDPAEERSRATMWDVPRFAEYHDYNLILVENVVDAGKWVMFDAWLHAMRLLGYEYEIVYLNSMFTWPTPQSRDRMYTVFWKKGNPRPNLDFRPRAWCERCQVNVESIQTWKKPNRKWGRYKTQYFYRCPHCHHQVEPYYYAAFNAIDFSIPAERIGDRKKSLRPKTMARIQYGLETFGRKPMIVTTSYGDEKNRARDAYEATMPTQVGTDKHAIVMPWLVETNYTGENRAETAAAALATQTARQSVGVAMPSFLVKTVRQDGEYSQAIDGADPLMCVTAGGNHHALLSADHFLTYYYKTTKVGGLNEPFGVVSTRDRMNLLGGALEAMTVDDLTFRMLQPHEIGKAMAFPGNYVVLGNGRQKVKQYGNAVTPPAMEMLIQRGMETFA